MSAEGYAYHPECFVCAKCGKKISGGFQSHKGNVYHGTCYKEKLGYFCASCGKLLRDAWIVHEGKKYHSDCLNLYCVICGQSISGEYTYDEKGNYHKSCFINARSPRCSVCEQPIVGEYLKDPWGHISHMAHGNHKTRTCDYCTRIVSNHTSNGGTAYNDGRIVCGVCQLTAVTTVSRIIESQKRVLKLLASTPASFTDIPHKVPVQLVDRTTLNRLAGRKLSDHGQGLTNSKVITQGNKRIKIEHHVYILYGMPQLAFEGVLAHELLHVWLNEHNIKMSEKETEGFCNLGQAMVYEKDNSKLAQSFLEQLENSDDRIYGKGYRKMKKQLQRYGWTRLKRLLLR